MHHPVPWRSDFSFVAPACGSSNAAPGPRDAAQNVPDVAPNPADAALNDAAPSPLDASGDSSDGKAQQDASTDGEVPLSHRPTDTPCPAARAPDTTASYCDDEAPGDFPGGKEGDVLTVEFTVLGIPCLGLNGGPQFKHSEAFSWVRLDLSGRDQAALASG
jgi:hypothetical protein